jgi:hypothetical protein
MKHLLFLLLFVTSTVAAESYLHLNGVSKHNKSGYNEQNWGAGYEQSINSTWTAAVGAYNNSEYRHSVYAYARYSVYKNNQWDIGINSGIVTGYRKQSVLPLALPEVCYNWVCSMIIPQVGGIEASAITARLRIPIK